MGELGEAERNLLISTCSRRSSARTPEGGAGRARPPEPLGRGQQPGYVNVHLTSTRRGGFQRTQHNGHPCYLLTARGKRRIRIFAVGLPSAGRTSS